MAEGQQRTGDSVSSCHLKAEVTWVKQNNTAHPSRLGLQAPTGYLEVLLLKHSPGHWEIPTISYLSHFKGKLQ